MKRARGGFSLMESLISLTILALMFGAILSLYTHGQKTFINESAQAEAIEQSRYPLAWITRDVKMAAAIEASWGSYATSADTLILKVPSVDANGIIIDLAAHSDRVIYRVQNDRLFRIVDAEDGVSARIDRSRVLADGMAPIAFVYYDADGAALGSGFDRAACVQPTLTARRHGMQRNFSESLQTKVKLRNK
jgi:prepilin-type N-terminal cleavage/methylation domain-containing protein